MKRLKLPSGGSVKVHKQVSAQQCTSTGTSITFTRDGKKVTRVIYKNARGTKYVKYDNEWVLVSKLKVIK